jgi:hypothetical protein
MNIALKQQPEGCANSECHHKLRSDGSGLRVELAQSREKREKISSQHPVSKDQTARNSGKPASDYRPPPTEWRAGGLVLPGSLKPEQYADGQS